jgi:uncharacterized protein (TIGR02266 family)
MGLFTQKNYQDGNIIFREGSQGDCVYIIESGAVIISREIDSKKLILDVLREGDVFGELAFLGLYPRTATARALGGTTLGVIERESLLRAVNSLDPDMQKLFMSLAARLKKATESAAGMTMLRREPRLLAKWSITFPLSDSTVEAHTKNASPQGLFISTEKPLSPGDIFLLDITLPSGEKLEKIACEVAWSRTSTHDEENLPCGMGIRFMVLGVEEQEKITNSLKLGAAPGKR